jgi:hypothetical protein
MRKHRGDLLTAEEAFGRQLHDGVQCEQVDDLVEATSVSPGVVPRDEITDRLSSEQLVDAVERHMPRSR